MKSAFLLLLCLLSLLGCKPDVDEQLAYQQVQKTLERSQGQLRKRQQELLKGMRYETARYGCRLVDVRVREVADSLLNLSGSATALLDSMEVQLAGIAQEHPGSTGKVKQYLYGGSQEEKNELGLLYRYLRQVEFSLQNRLRNSPPLPAVPGSYATYDTVYRGNVAAFSRQFEHILPHEARMYVAHLRTSLAINTTSGLESLASKLGGELGYSRTMLFANPKHAIVEAGSLYEADLILRIGGITDWALIGIQLDGKPVGSSFYMPKASFVAKNGTPGGSLQYWEGRFTFTNRDGRDTTLILRRPYWVYSRSSSLPLHTYHP